MRSVFIFLLLQVAIRLVSCDPLVDNIDHIIVIYEENWSFDAMFAAFPGANGYISNTSVVLHPQVDKNGSVYSTLPAIYDIPSGLPNMPFEISQFVSDGLIGYPDPTHKFYEEQYMINGGLMNGYIAWNSASSIGYSYWNSTDEYIGRLAQNYTLFDNFFHSAFGPSLLNHFWLACACTPKWVGDRQPPTSLVATIGPDGIYTNPSAPPLTPDLYVVGTLSPAIPPIDPSQSPSKLVPPLLERTIGEDLNDANVSWVYYQDGYGDANSGHASPDFEYNHNPYLYFKNFANGTALRATHMKDTDDFFVSLKDGTLPSVSFVKPTQPHNFHPHSSDRNSSQIYLENMINAIQASPNWPRTMVVITFDEHGGFFDHVAPPVIDRWGPGSRVPCIVVSPFAKKGYIDHTQSETLSVHRLIQRRFSIPILGDRKVEADLVSSLDFSASTTSGTTTTSNPTTSSSTTTSNPTTSSPTTTSSPPTTASPTTTSSRSTTTTSSSTTSTAAVGSSSTGTVAPTNSAANNTLVFTIFVVILVIILIV